MPVLEAVKSQKWGAGSPTVVTYIHILSSPPPPGTFGSCFFCGEGRSHHIRFSFLAAVGCCTKYICQNIYYENVCFTIFSGENGPGLS